MIILISILVVIVLVKSPILRYSVIHLPTVTFNAFIDIRKYIKFKRWNEFSGYGRMDIYIADDNQPFGSGKTLNMVKDAISIYKNYNDVDVYDFSSESWVKQYVHIISNLALYGVDYVKLESTSQITDLVNMEYGSNNDIHIYLVLIDELGRIFNNRDWKTNLPSDLLGALLQQRKNRLIIKGTVQDFSLFDATLRKLSSVVYVCHKRWRFLVRDIYAATDLERSGYNLRMISSRGSGCGFATDRLYNSYNTNEVVSDLARNVVEGKQLTNYEVLQSSITNLPYVPKAKRKKGVLDGR